jgi:enoyl-CoA hydratase
MTEDIASERQEAVGVVRIGRADALTTLNLAALERIVAALERFDADAAVRCLLLAGSERAFVAGTDVAELASASMVDVYQRDAFARWERLRRIRKPVVAAVSGYAMGGGCELLLACDIVVASETARLALPEVGMGTIPGGGGIQRLTRAVGKARAMDLVLTGRTLTAREAAQIGLISRVVPREHYFTEALALCRELAKRPPLAVQMAKEAILKAEEMSLAAGLEYERNLFYLLFGTADQREGLRAFLEKRPAVFMGK